LFYCVHEGNLPSIAVKFTAARKSGGRKIMAVGFLSAAAAAQSNKQPDAIKSRAHGGDRTIGNTPPALERQPGQ
jgi:hypothetical protein